MNKHLHEFHRHQTAKANEHILCLASMLLLGSAPRHTEAALAGCRKAVGDVYAPWLFPVIEDSATVKELLGNKELLAVLDGDTEDRWTTYDKLFSLLMRDLGGYNALSQYIETTTKEMTVQMRRLDPFLNMLDDIMGLHEAASGMKTELVIHGNPSDDIRAAVEAVVTKGTAEGLSPEAIEQGIIDIVKKTDKHAKFALVTVGPDGEISGSLDGLPEDFKAQVLEASKEAKKIHATNQR